MLLNRSRQTVFCFSVVCAALFVGCGGPTPVELSGKIVLPSNLKLVETDTVELALIAEGPGAKGAQPKVDLNDLSFSTKEVVPGKYKITFKVTPYPGMPESQKRAPAFDALNKANELRTTKLSCEVTSDAKQSLSIDIVKGTVTKN